MSTEEIKSVCIVGSGNWGSVIAKIVGQNAITLPHVSEKVTMYVFDEVINGRKLSEIINSTHENIKYLPGHKLPESVIAVPSLLEACQEADILVFVLPHQFIHSACCTLKNRIKKTAVGLSLIKGFHKAPGGGIELISHIIAVQLSIPCYVLMGANLANEIASEAFSEATIGCDDANMGSILKELMQTPYFRVAISDDKEGVEICGALKNIVACAAGFVDGLNLGDNTKAATIRIGLIEMIKFTQLLFPNSKINTFFESCGVADVIASCFGGRNRKVSEEFAKTGKTFQELEESMLKGQKVQGPPTAEEVNYMLKARNMEDQYPLFTAVHQICIQEIPPVDLMKRLQEFPE